MLDTAPETRHEPRRSGECCPMCGKAYEKRPVHVDTTTGFIECGAWKARYGRRKTMALDALVRAYPGGLTREKLAAAVYDDHDDDHVPWPAEVIMSHVSGLRKLLRKSKAPFHIEAKRFLGYRLVMEPDSGR